MHPKLPRLFEERGFLRARIADRRKVLAGHGEAIARLSAAGDSVCSVTRWVKEHLFALGLVGGVVMLVLRPKRLPRAFRVGKRAFGLWRIGKKLISRLSFLRLFAG
ncbi:MAG: YqjK-like family protein [Betaproteobacteria bacterium]|nr:YqjK-like family protein [Betaproteobacteria bacterium]